MRCYNFGGLPSVQLLFAKMPRSDLLLASSMGAFGGGMASEPESEAAAMFRYVESIKGRFLSRCKLVPDGFCGVCSILESGRPDGGTALESGSVMWSVQLLGPVIAKCRPN